MYQTINEFFISLSNEYFASIIMCAVIIGIMGKLCDIYLIPKLNLKNADKRVYASLLLMGALLLIINVIIELLFKTPLTWWLGVLALILGGGLGFVPFSFAGKKKR